MASINQITLIGRVGNKNTKTFQNGNTIVEVSVATSEKWKDREGNMQEETQWHRAIISGTLAGVADRYLNKGDVVYLQGKMTYRSYTDKNGQEKTSPEIRVLTMQLLPQGGTGASKGAPSVQSQVEEDIPF